MKADVLFSRKSDEWGTPQEFYAELNKEFHFDLDPASTDSNALCPCHFTQKQDGLLQDWGGHSVFCNPPYSHIGEWIRKGWQESCKDGTTVVMLVPSRTDTRWFHQYVLHRAEVRFVTGRIKFGDSAYNAPFPSMVVIWRAGGITA